MGTVIVSVAGYAKLAALMAGFVGLGIELAAERLLAPAFGTTLDLWSIIIGLTFAALSAGYEIGGRYIDRHPDVSFLSICLMASGVWTLGIAFLGRDVAFWIQELTFDFGGATLGIFLSVLLLITVPPFILGMVTPAAIRLTVPRVGESGTSAGTIFALTTIGALIGTFTPVLLLMPFIGVQLTFVTVGMVGIIAAIPGLAGMVQQEPVREIHGEGPHPKPLSRHSGEGL